VIAFGNDAIIFGPKLVTLFHSSIALMERPSQERDPAVKLQRDHRGSVTRIGDQLVWTSPLAASTL
jgi:hypothetical protein